ncbi:MAG: CRISPR-associated protein Cas4 [Candidatus Methanoperedens sp.]|jgi:CRISPR-associated exonuclease Cas4|nr:CRISPR-associated protein Cas4 [Candidatus Methanoperedens sp.]PKL53614.1 MAG: CRISPR-associated protein Cas4 [Candidatus Methanoperedenaceae archaeon HGW-Methanoperedenaceae-1]
MDGETIVTISDVLEYLFCPRFTYFMRCLDIPQHEESRFKVLKGRDVHEQKRITNTAYLRKKLGVVGKELNVFIASKRNHIKGIVDEVVFLEDGTAAPFEYKFAEFKDKIFKTYKFQLVLHALMIKENYNVDVKKGFICFTRSNNHIEEVVFTEKDFDKAVEIVGEILEIIDKGFYPGKTNSKNKCFDCCYSNICT